ncbi:MAG: S9 family peptidase [Candidatus Eremiobacteraeota bacterium]|nr:S9 family peptidase [Candidatus Eremiobacteraeota bacterium]
MPARGPHEHGLERDSNPGIAPLLLALTAPPAIASPAANAPFTIGALHRIVGFSSPRVSPDGKQIVFVRSVQNLQTDGYDGTLMLMDVATRAQRPLSVARPKVDSPLWSPGGERIAFLSSGKEPPHRTQIFVMSLNGGDPIQVTDAPRDVEQFIWRADGRALAYLTGDEPPKKTGIARFEDGYKVTDNAYLSVGPFYPSHLWLTMQTDSVSRDWTSKRLTRGAWSVAAGAAQSTLSFGPDGHRLAYVRIPNPLLADADRSIVELVNPQTALSRQLTSRSRYEYNPRISPDGKHVSYTYARAGDPNNLAAIYLSSGNGAGGELAARFDGNAGDYAWFPDSSGVLVGADSGSRRGLWKLNLDGTFARYDLGDLNVVGDFDQSITRNGAIAFIGVGARNPGEIYFLRSLGARPEQLTDDNAGIAKLNFGRVETISWDGPGGLHEDGVLTYPVGWKSGASYPLVLLIHGGPTEASTTSFDQLGQLMAARGWLVFQPNYRGSDNAGDAYAHAIYMDPVDGPGKDIMAGLAAVQRATSVDAKRVCVTGWSYGGLMTSWLITHYHQWRCAVSGAAVNDLVYDYVLADDGASDRLSMRGRPFASNNLRAYRNASPLTYAADVTTPTLILGDTYDVRVPAPESYAFYHALRDRGVPVEFYQWPVHSHFPGDPIRIADVYRHWMGWIAKYFAPRS